MFRTVLIGILLLFASGLVCAQSGDVLYPFLNVPVSVSASGVGGNSVSSQERDLNLVFHNPAILSTEMNNGVEVGYMNYISDIQLGSAAFTRKINDRSAWMAGIRYINYGEMLWTNSQNDILGTTYAGDLALTGAYSWKISEFWRAGGSLSMIYSVLDQYTSVGLGVDLGLYYNNPSQFFSAGFVLKNMGAEVVAYDETYEKMPWDVQFGLSKKFAHAPFRLTMTVQNLTNWNTTYLAEVENSDGTVVASDNLAKKIFKHTLFGFEFVPSENFLLSLGYNYRRQSELAIAQRTAFSGFTAGFSIKVKNARVGASFAKYHASGSSLQLTYGMDLSKIGL
ncbi:MAG TPA: type IX secretion system protein PorQ [Bacteroidales bacterium]|nr:type IX secretion system protein PorQ [Bacteroidales bacterium]